MLPEDEIWKVVPTNSNYGISSWGRVMRITEGRNTVKGKMLRASCDKYGYRVMNLSSGGDARQVKVHSLVTEAFIGIRADGMQVNHKNGDKGDNRLSNLEYVTPKENNHHAIRMGLNRVLCGEEHRRSKLSEAQVREIFDKVSNGASQIDVANRFGVRRQTISRIKFGRTWRHLNLVGGSL